MQKTAPQLDPNTESDQSPLNKTNQIGTSPPTESESEIEFELTLVLKLDNYPSETGWTITSLEEKNIVASKPSQFLMQEEMAYVVTRDLGFSRFY